jgi:hypothetical protein
MKFSKFFLIGLILVSGLVIGMAVPYLTMDSSVAAANDDVGFKFQYAAKFVCGQSFRQIEFQAGKYSTAVNVHNPSGEAFVLLRKKIAMTSTDRPEEGPEFRGKVSEYIFEDLGPDQAFAVDCEEIPSEFISDFPGIPGTLNLVEGFLVIESTESIDVTAVYTASGWPGAQSRVSSIDVEQIRERQLY